MQQALQVLGALALRDVASDLRYADDVSHPVAHGRDCERDVDAPAVLGQTHGFVVVDAFAAPDLGENLRLLAQQLVRDDLDDRLADHFFSCITEDAHRACIPRGDLALERLADDRVI